MFAVIGARIDLAVVVRWNAELARSKRKVGIARLAIRSLERLFYCPVGGKWGPMTQKFSDALEKPIGIYYEHPEWFRPLFQQLDERGVNWTKIDIRDHSYR